MRDGHYDVIVVGLGIMGAGALYQLAKRGANVLGIDRFVPPHNYGSSHGDTRITRQAIGEGEMYMPFIQRSNEIWHELEQATNRTLYYKTGGLIIAPRGGGAQFHAHGDFIARTADIATTYGVEHELLSAQETSRRFPMLKMRSQDVAYYEPGGGVLHAELCIQVQLEQAVHHGAMIHTNEVVTAYQAKSDGVTVTTDGGTYEADRIVIAAGAWVTDLLSPDYTLGIEVYRQIICWFSADDLDVFIEENFPFLIWIGDRPEDFYSAFATLRDGIHGVKMVTEQYTETTTPHMINRDATPDEVVHLYQLCEARLDGVQDNLIHADVCMYTVTPDEHFILDFHPESRRVVIASPCSGHGFKHSAAIGETLAELALAETTTLDIRKFSLARLIT